MKKRDCPCTSGRPYASCCAPYHRGAEPPDCVALVRSRFSAFALGDGDYLFRTLAEEHADRAAGRVEFARAIKRGAETLRFMKLTILEDRPPDEEGIARVRFLATIFERGRDRSFEELSRFRHDGEGWRYVEGETGAPGAG